MAITKIKGTSSFTNLTKYDSFLAGNNINDYESIATTTVGAGGASSVTFSSIPSTYTHLQIRVFGQTSRGTYGNDEMTMRINGNTGNNYSDHYVRGDGSVVAASSGVTKANINLIYMLGTTTSNAFGVFIIDVLDYANTSKNKTIRSLSGVDINGTIATYGGEVGLISGAYYSTDAVNSLTFTPSNANFTQYSSFALYGIRG